MDRLPGARALSFAYFLPVSALAVALAVLGSLLDRLLPAAASRAYQRALLGALAALSRPLDGLHAVTAPRPDTTD